MQVNRVAEGIKCNKDFAYWLTNYAFIEDKEKGGQVKFKLWKSQQRILPLFLTAVYLFILKARQLGLTWLTAAYCLWLAMTKHNQLIVIISMTEKKAVEFLDRVKFILERLPVWMKPAVLKRTNDTLHLGFEEKDNRGNIVVKGFNSIIQSLTTTPRGAQSMTPNLVVLDEAAEIENIKKIWTASKPGVDLANGRIIVISNAIKHGPGWHWFRTWYIKAWRGNAGRIKHLFMSWKDHPDRPPDFRERQLEEGYDEDDLCLHYPATIEEAIEALSGSFFERYLKHHTKFESGQSGHLQTGSFKFWNDLLDDQRQIIFSPKRHGVLTVWHEPDRSGQRDRYCIFSDISEGTGNSDSVAYVFDRVEREFIVKLQSSNIDADLWGDELMILAAWVGNIPMICPEVSGAGHTTVKKLRDKKYPRIFKHRQIGRSRGTITTRYGWVETKDHKRFLSECLKTYLRDKANKIYDGELIDQCSTYVELGGGRLGAEDQTKKDDCVIAAGGCLVMDSFLQSPRRIKEGLKKADYGNVLWQDEYGFSESKRDPWIE